MRGIMQSTLRSSPTLLPDDAWQGTNFPLLSSSTRSPCLCACSFMYLRNASLKKPGLATRTALTIVKSIYCTIALKICQRARQDKVISNCTLACHMLHIMLEALWCILAAWPWNERVSFINNRAWFTNECAQTGRMLTLHLLNLPATCWPQT